MGLGHHRGIAALFLLAGVVSLHGAVPKVRLRAVKPAPVAKAKPAPAPVSKVLDLKSSSALVLDQKTGELLYEKHPEDVRSIASITKLTTAMVVLDAHLNLDEEISIEQEDVDNLKHSRSRLPVGTVMTRGQAMHLALMSSENRAAHALGRTYPGGLAAFIPAMNAKARSLGLTDTHYVDPTGLSEENVSCAKDLAKLVETAYQYDKIREFTTCDETTIEAKRRLITFHNSNRLVRSPSWQIGLSKTGFIEEAGRCLVMQAWVAQRSVVIVLLDSVGNLSRFGDANRIKQWMEKALPASAFPH